MADAPQNRPEAVFAVGLEIADPAARAAYLHQTCGADARLRQEVDMLLAAHAKAEADDFMSRQRTLHGDPRSNSPFARVWIPFTPFSLKASNSI